MPDRYDYKAFISYSHQDSGWARWLHRRLETYTVPKRLIGRVTQQGPISKRLGSIFRDREELSSEADLGAAVTRALAESQFLIVLCSPDSARSRWVNEEVLAYKRLGREDTILTITVAGDEDSGEDLSQTCFCEALRFRLDDEGNLSGIPVEPLSADARSVGDGRRRALLKVIASLLGVKLDELQQRDLQRRHRRSMVVSLASLGGMVLTLSLAITAYIARNDANQRRDHVEQLLSFMVGDLRESLEPIGRLDLLEQVGNEAMSYFASVKPSDLTDEGLANHSKALTQIGNIRLSQHRYDDALQAFTDAYERSTALANRNPANTNFLFTRGQAEFWVGYVYWRHGQLDQAQTWLRLYRDTSVALLETDPDREDWLFEVISGHHNLAVISLEKNDLTEAEAGFRRERDILLEMVVGKNFDPTLTDQLAIAESWLGTTTQRQGTLSDSANHFHQSASYREAIATADPDDAIARFRWALSLLFVARGDSITGNLETAASGLHSVTNTLQSLVEKDPDNREWRRTYGLSLMRMAEVQLATSDTRALANAQRALEELRKAVGVEGGDREGARVLALADALVARILWTQGDDRGAIEHVNTSLRLLQPHYALAQTDQRMVGALGHVLALSAFFAERTGNSTLATEHLQKARDLLAVPAENSGYYMVLDPWVRVTLALGEQDRATKSLSVLHESGYRPLIAWPER